MNFSRIFTLSLLFGVISCVAPPPDIDPGPQIHTTDEIENTRKEGEDESSFARLIGSYKSDAFDYGRQCPDGGYILFGTESDYKNYNSIYLIKLNALGETVWVKKYNSEYGDSPTGLDLTEDGGFILSAKKNVDRLNSSTILTKTDANGEIIWKSEFSILSSYGGTDYNGDLNLGNVIQTVDGGYILSGGGENSTLGYRYATLLKVDASGSEEWDLNEVDATYSKVSNCPDGNIVYLINRNSETDDRTIIGKRDLTGIIVDSKVISDTTFYALYGVVETSDGYIIYGSQWNFGPPYGTTGIIQKFYTNRSDAWSRKFLSEGFNAINKLTLSEKGSIICLGYKQYNEITALKLESGTGGTIWTKAFSNKYYPYFQDVDGTSDDGVLLSGNIVYRNPRLGYVTKLNSSGQ